MTTCDSCKLNTDRIHKYHNNKLLCPYCYDVIVVVPVVPPPYIPAKKTPLKDMDGNDLYFGYMVEDEQ